MLGTNMPAIFRDRDDAGKQLAKKLSAYQDTDAVVLAIPRGGVPIGEIIARKLHLPLDLALSKKIGHPLHHEYAIGAVSLRGSTINPGNNDVPGVYIENEIKKLRQNLQQRYALFKGSELPVDLKSRKVIVTDDGIATGSTILSTIDMIKQQGASEIVVAVPVAPADAVEKLKSVADQVIVLTIPAYFVGVGQFYHDFTQVEDEEVIRLLKYHPQ